MTTIVIKPINPDESGHLRRQRKALEFSRSLITEPSPEDLDRLVEFLLDYVAEPADIEERREAIWEASENQFQQLLNAIAGVTTKGDTNPT